MESIGKTQRNVAIIRSLSFVLNEVRSFDEYWVDLERECLITHWARFMGNEIYAKADIRYEHRDTWVPVSWDTSFSFLSNRKITFTFHRIKVIDCQLNPAVDADQFQVELSSGMIVLDREKGNREKLYRVNQDQSLSDITGEPRLNLNEPNRYLWWITVSVITILLCFVLGYRLWRTRLRNIHN